MDNGAFIGVMLGLFFGGFCFGYGGYSVHTDYPLIAVMSYIFGGGCVAASIVLILLRIEHYQPARIVAPTPTASQEQSGDASSPSQMRNVDDFYKTYDNALLIEFETNIRNQTNQYPSGQIRENILIRLMATLIIYDLFERTWLNIFGSQLKALQRLSTTPLSLAELRQYYEDGVINNTQFYEKYSFEQWLTFLRNWVLILQQDKIEITVRGREFLKYIVHVGYDVNLRPG